MGSPTVIERSRWYRASPVIRVAKPAHGREGGQYQGPGQDGVQAAFVGGPRSVGLVMMQAMTARGLDAAGGYDGSAAERRAVITDGGVATCTDLPARNAGPLIGGAGRLLNVCRSGCR